MTNKEKKEQKKQNRNYKTYFIFLTFTAFLWFTLQFTKNYSQEITFTIKYTNIENQKVIKPTSDQEIKMILNGSGLQLLKYAFIDRVIDLDIRKSKNLNENHAFFSGNQMHDILKSSLGYDGDISNIFKDTLHVHYDVYRNIKVPLKIKSNINFASGFTSIKGLTSKQSDVLVTGPKSVLDTLKFITTREVKLSEVKKDFIGFAAIEKDSFPRSLKFAEDKISVELLVDKLTEGEFQVPVTLLNVPKNIRVQLFPKQVKVVFSVTLNDYPKLSATDFSVTANMIKANPNRSSLLLKLENFPDFIYNARLMEKEVQYVVIK